MPPFKTPPNSKNTPIERAAALFRDYLGATANSIVWGELDTSGHVTGTLALDSHVLSLRYSSRPHRPSGPDDIQMYPDEAMHVATACPADVSCQKAWMRFFGSHHLTQLIAGRACEPIECADHAHTPVGQARPRNLPR